MDEDNILMAVFWVFVGVCVLVLFGTAIMGSRGVETQSTNTVETTQVEKKCHKEIDWTMYYFFKMFTYKKVCE